MGLEPSNRRDRILGKYPEIASIGQSIGGVLHVLFETGVDPIRCVEPHVGRTPACIAAGFAFARLFKQGNLDGPIAAAGLLSRRKRRRKAGGSVSDHN